MFLILQNRIELIKDFPQKGIIIYHKGISIVPFNLKLKWNEINSISIIKSHGIFSVFYKKKFINLTQAKKLYLRGEIKFIENKQINISLFDLHQMNSKQYDTLIKKLENYPPIQLEYSFFMVTSKSQKLNCPICEIKNEIKLSPEPFSFFCKNCKRKLYLVHCPVCSYSGIVAKKKNIDKLGFIEEKEEKTLFYCNKCKNSWEL